MKNMWSFVTFLQALFLLIKCGTIPSFVHLCKRYDTNMGDCFTKAVNELIPHLTNSGIPEINVPSIDPLYFESLKVETGNMKSVNLQVDLKNGTVLGLRKMNIKDHIMNLEQVHSTVKLHLPEINIEANYKVLGKILLFELNGAGHASYNASDITTDVDWSGTYYTKMDKRHLQLDQVQFNNVEIGKMAIRLDGLFGDDEILTNTVNNAVNENIAVLKEELEPIFKRVLSDFVLEYFNRVYRLFPAEQLFPEI